MPMITIRLTVAEKELVDAAVKGAGMNRSHYLRGVMSGIWQPLLKGVNNAVPQREEDGGRPASGIRATDANQKILDAQHKRLAASAAERAQRRAPNATSGRKGARAKGHTVRGNSKRRGKSVAAGGGVGRATATA
jgi:hypothetical protein